MEERKFKTYQCVFNHDDNTRFFQMLKDMDPMRQKIRKIIPGGYQGEAIFMAVVELYDEEYSFLKLAFDFIDITVYE